MATTKVTDPAQLIILLEIKRLSKVLRAGNAPDGGGEIIAILIDMLTTVLTGQITEEEFLDIITANPILAKVHEYYIKFFAILNKVDV